MKHRRNPTQNYTDKKIDVLLPEKIQTVDERQLNETAICLLISMFSMEN